MLSVEMLKLGMHCVWVIHEGDCHIQATQHTLGMGRELRGCRLITMYAAEETDCIMVQVEHTGTQKEIFAMHMLEFEFCVV